MTHRKKVSFEEELSLTPLESEIITLKAVLDMINDMVNRETMLFHFNDEHGSEIRFNGLSQKAFFNILLVDFLCTPKGFFKDSKSYLERLCPAPLYLIQI